MHTYRATSNREGKHGFQVGTENGGTFTAVGPHVEDEGEAAALASYLNGGDYKPNTASDLFKPAADARAKVQKEQDALAKAEKERQEAAANPPKPEPEDPVPPPPPKENPKPRAHAAKAKQHVKTAKPTRKHK